MIPWHLTRPTPEEEADIIKRLQRMHDRFDMPMEILETENGYIARRDGNTGRGATLMEAKLDLRSKEHQEAVDPLGIMARMLAQEEAKLELHHQEDQNVINPSPMVSA
jgi:hypothetical protein